MAKNKITVQLKGSVADNEDVRLADFIEELSAIREILSEIDQKIIKSSEPSTDYRIVDLSHFSPARVVIEAIPLEEDRDNSVAVVDKFFVGLKAIQQGKVPEEFESPLLERFKKLGRGFHRNIREVVISRDDSQISIRKNFEAEIVKIIGDDQLSSGSMTGMLEMINLHRGANKFNIYPFVGPDRLACHFSSSLLREAIDGLNQYVRVTGKLKYKQRDRFPYAIDVEEIEVFPGEDELPTIFDLRGIAPKATGDMSSVEFVRKLRNASP